MNKYKRIAMVIVIMLAGLTSTYEATYTDVHVVMEAVVLGEDPWWIPLWLNITIVGTDSGGWRETIAITCVPLSIFIWGTR